MSHFARRISVILATLALALPAQAANTIRAVMHSDLRVIDPGFTTAYITRDHGYMVYDTLLSTLPQRFSEATQSSAVTGVPSCHFNPSRSVKV